MNTKFLNGLDFNKAFSDILNEGRKRGNPIPDPLLFSYCVTEQKEFFDKVKEAIGSKRYVVKPMLNIDVPKANFTIRPMGRPEIQDWVLYQAIVNLIKPTVVSHISDRSYSVIKFRDETPSEIIGWNKFEEKKKKLYFEGYNFVVVSDITGYFEHIDLEELRNKLINHIGNDDIQEVAINFLFHDQLYKWSPTRIRNFGLPQGLSASSFLGDVYLDNIDGEMEDEPGYFRYMDDIIIFTKSFIDAKSALVKLTRALRQYKLSMNAKKTKIWKDKEIEKYVLDEKKPALDTIEEAFKLKKRSNIDLILPLLEDIFVKGFEEKNPFGKRHINFAIFRLGILKASSVPFNESKIIDLLIEKFINHPHQSELFCRFFSLFPKEKKITEFLVEFLSSKNNIYEWQEMHILRYLLEPSIKLPNIGIGIFTKKCKREYKDKNKHWAVRSLYALLLGKYGSASDREILRDSFCNEREEELRRNILIAIQGLGKASRNDFYNKIKDDVWLPGFIKYLKKMGKDFYLKPYEQIRFEFSDEQEEYEGAEFEEGMNESYEHFISYGGY